MEEIEVVQMYARGVSADEIATLAGKSHQWVYDVLRRNAVELRPQRKAYRLGLVNWDAVAADYRGDELSVEQICAAHGIHIHELYKFLALRPDIVKRSARGLRAKRESVEKLQKVLPNRDLDAAVQAYMEGMKVIPLLAEFGLSPATFYKELHLRGIETRR